MELTGGQCCSADPGLVWWSVVSLTSGWTRRSADLVWVVTSHNYILQYHLTNSR